MTPFWTCCLAFKILEPDAASLHSSSYLYWLCDLRQIISKIRKLIPTLPMPAHDRDKNKIAFVIIPDIEVVT